MKLSPDLTRRILELAGEANPRTSVQPPTPRPDPRVRLVVWYPGLIVRSEANTGGRLRDKITRKTLVKVAILDGLPTMLEPSLPRPVRVVLTRVGGKKLDSDNLQTAFKACRDAVCTWLGVDDGDRQSVRFVYRQRAGWRAGVRVAIG